MKHRLQHFWLVLIVATIALFINGCSSLVPVRTKQDVEDLTTLEEIKGPEIDYAKALKDGATVLTPEGEGKVELVSIGELELTSGKVIACDALVFYNAKPFTQKVPPGTYPVKLAVVESNKTKRNALAAIIFSNEPTVRWENARPETQLETEENEMFAYGVDSGSGSFMDYERGREFLKLLGQNTPASKALDDQIVTELEKKRKAGSSDWAKISAPGIKGSVFIFGSGEGDGAYTSFFGFDASGNVTTLVTDFGIIALSIEQEAAS
ncbi:MAG: DUF4241 domain-containing protein [Acidobacteria bacterium]|nr:DUF4241 domain-containing protein [Acidobacteriota bacterium]